MCDMASLVGRQVQNLNRFILQRSELTTLDVFMNLGLSTDHLQGLWLSLSRCFGEAYEASLAWSLSPHFSVSFGHDVIILVSVTWKT